jgi:hypothetical protein
MAMERLMLERAWGQIEHLVIPLLYVAFTMKAILVQHPLSYDRACQPRILLGGAGASS